MPPGAIPEVCLDEEGREVPPLPSAFMGIYSTTLASLSAVLLTDLFRFLLLQAQHLFTEHMCHVTTFTEDVLTLLVVFHSLIWARKKQKVRSFPTSFLRFMRLQR